MSQYTAESFTPEEEEILRRYFTNLDLPVFALVNLPEVVKGALFARYSRTHLSLRRLFLEEFVGELDVEGDTSIDATMGLARAEELYRKVFYEYGDDSVAQLGGVHLACEQASNLLTKILEWGRLMSYLEQSTRYLAYDRRLGGRYRYYRDPEILASELGTRYVGDLDRIFDSYATLLPMVQKHFSRLTPRGEGVSDIAYRQTIRARSFDVVRGMLPAASLSNVGIYGTGQAYEALLLRMRAHPLPEARSYAAMMLHELRKVIPSFLRRVDVENRGVAWSRYLADTRSAVEELAAELLADTTPAEVDDVDLVDWDPEAEDKMLAAMLYPHSDLPERQILDRVRALSAEDRLRLTDTYVGERVNRRHRPGRALEVPSYGFDILSDYGAFRDLQRHRMLTLQWQDLSPHHGYVRPEAVAAAGGEELYDRAMDRSAALHEDLRNDFPRQAPYAVAMAFRVRYSMKLNARSALHMIELRSSPAGHPAYRRIVQQMYRRIEDVAGHTLVARAFRHVDMGEGEQGRLSAEIRTDRLRVGDLGG